MQIIEPSIEVTFHIPESHGRIEAFLEDAGRTCYKSQDRITPESADRFVAMLKKRGHHAMLEHAVASARIVCDRGVTHELVRHRLASYAQESTRYCDYTKEKHGGGINVIQPVGLIDPSKCSVTTILPDPEHYIPIRRLTLEKAVDLIEKGDPEGAATILKNMMAAQYSEYQFWATAMEWADQSYRMMRAVGSPPERARHVLPIGVKTEIVITANLREWMHIFSLRCAPAAHPHIRDLFLQALQVFADRVPSMFGGLLTEFTGKTVEAK